jgi:hypothetical protein
MLQLRRMMFAVAVLTAISVSPVRAQQQAPTALARRGLVGTIVDLAGAPVPFAYIQEVKGDRFTVSDKDGRFRFPPVESGYHSFTARRLGFYPTQFDADLTGDSTVTVSLTLAPNARILKQVSIEGDRPRNYTEGLDRQGFYRRLQERSLGAGTGHFIMPDDMARRHPNQITQMLQALPGVSVVAMGFDRAGQGSVPVGRGGSCTLGLVLDGQRVEYSGSSSAQTLRIQSKQTQIAKGQTREDAIGGGDIKSGAMTFDQLINPSDVRAIEVYPTAVGVPLEFASHTRGCGLVVVWTKRDG